MTDNLPAPNETSPASQCALPDAWIEKIFLKLEGRYGTLFLDRWRGCDMGNVRQTWAEELAGFKDQPERIAYALRSLSESQFPPTLPEFIAACRRAPTKPNGPALAHHQTPEERQRAREAAEQAAQAVKPRTDDSINRHWATHPKSVMHLRFIFEAARNDPRFAPCIAEMVENGICTEDGHLLKSYKDGQWWPIHRRVA